MESSSSTSSPSDQNPDNDNNNNHKITRYNIRTENLSYKLSNNNNNNYLWQFIKRSSEKAVSPDPTPYILKGITCEARAGEVSAIAGPSGAGKTTLLEVLAGAALRRRVSGGVFVNDCPMDLGKFRRISGYVTQDDDALFPLLTVEETLAYSARLRLCRRGRSVVVRVRELLKELGLEHVAKTRLGGGGVGPRRGNGVSGGERRRVSIGVEIVNDPAVVLLDEPTSGLDSASALHVALMLKSMAAKRGKTVILTIHQPGFRILDLFDRVLLLSGGSLVHNGSLSSLKTRLENSLSALISRHVTVLELAIESTDSLAGEQPEIRENRLLSPFVAVEECCYKYSYYANGLAGEVSILSRRFSSNVFRTKTIFAARIVMSLLVGTILGTIFMDCSNKLGFFAFSLTFLLSATTEGLPIYLRERNILMRETSRGAYRVSSYVISNALVFVPFLFVVAFLYATPVYWLVGLKTDIGAFFYFLIVVWLVFLMSNSFVSFCGAVAEDFISGTTLVGGLMGSFFLFSGYFIAERDIPKYWLFVHYLSLFKYPFECFVINEYGGGGEDRCIARLGSECVLSGEAFLAEKGLRESQKWTNLGVILGFIVGYRFLCFFVLWCRVHRTRR